MLYRSHTFRICANGNMIAMTTRPAASDDRRGKISRIASTQTSCKQMGSNMICRHSQMVGQLQRHRDVQGRRPA